jgi:hypothetical protein
MPLAAAKTDRVCTGVVECEAPMARIVGRLTPARPTSNEDRIIITSSVLYSTSTTMSPVHDFLLGVAPCGWFETFKPVATVVLFLPGCVLRTK